MSTWITRLDSHGGSGIRVAVKDLIDLVGIPTTAGSRVVADQAQPASVDAVCVAGLRAAEANGTAHIVGKVNLHELALGVTGINPWFGTPVNPVDPRRIPGGSSSGSAVAVGADEADVAYGSDTGGSVRIPAACCGVVGLKTTWGRIPLDGVWPLAPSLDTIGPLARDVDGVAIGMALLEPGFTPDSFSPSRIGRLRLPAHPLIDQAIDAALGAAELTVGDVEVPGWTAASQAGLTLLGSEAWASNKHLVARGGLGSNVENRLRSGSNASPDELLAMAAVAARWSAELTALWERIEVLALPTLVDFPPLLSDAEAMMTIRATVPVNLAGLPALCIPLPAGALPASLQLVGPAGSEERLIALGRRVEAAVAGT